MFEAPVELGGNALKIEQTIFLIIMGFVMEGLRNHSTNLWDI
jgi:hypothetical protein